MANRRTEGSGRIPTRQPTAGAPDTPPAHGAARSRAVLKVLEATGPTLGVVLVLHGGRATSRETVEARHLSPARMVPFARRLHRAGRKHGLAAWSLRNSVRGWNGAEMSPLQDARWALERITEQHPGVPVFLVGHSMGGLTAVWAASHPQVAAVVALAPWFGPGTPSSTVAGRKVLIVHGTMDRWTSPAQSLDFARRASTEAAVMQYVSLKGAGHFMLRKVRLWQDLTTGFVLKAFGETTGNSAAPSRGFTRLLPDGAVRVTL